MVGRSQELSSQQAQSVVQATPSVSNISTHLAQPLGPITTHGQEGGMGCMGPLHAQVMNPPLLHSWWEVIDSWKSMRHGIIRASAHVESVMSCCLACCGSCNGEGVGDRPRPKPIAHTLPQGLGSNMHKALQRYCHVVHGSPHIWPSLWDPSLDMVKGGAYRAWVPCTPKSLNPHPCTSCGSMFKACKACVME